MTTGTVLSVILEFDGQSIDTFVVSVCKLGLEGPASGNACLLAFCGQLLCQISILIEKRLCKQSVVPNARCLARAFSEPCKEDMVVVDRGLCYSSENKRHTDRELGRYVTVACASIPNQNLSSCRSPKKWNRL